MEQSDEIVDRNSSHTLNGNSDSFCLEVNPIFLLGNELLMLTRNRILSAKKIPSDFELSLI